MGVFLAIAYADSHGEPKLAGAVMVVTPADNRLDWAIHLLFGWGLPGAAGHRPRSAWRSGDLSLIDQTRLAGFEPGRPAVGSRGASV